MAELFKRVVMHKETLSFTPLALIRRLLSPQLEKCLSRQNESSGISCFVHDYVSKGFRNVQQCFIVDGPYNKTEENVLEYSEGWQKWHISQRLS